MSGMETGHDAPPVVCCRVCANPLWWDVTPVPGLAPGWYCSTCRHPPERFLNSVGAPPVCPEGCASSIVEAGSAGGARKFLCHRS